MNLCSLTETVKECLLPAGEGRDSDLLPARESVLEHEGLRQAAPLDRDLDLAAVVADRSVTFRPGPDGRRWLAASPTENLGIQLVSGKPAHVSQRRRVEAALRHCRPIMKSILACEDETVRHHRGSSRAFTELVGDSESGRTLDLMAYTEMASALGILTWWESRVLDILHLQQRPSGILDKVTQYVARRTEAG